jgi:hypothetical protein
MGGNMRFKQHPANAVEAWPWGLPAFIFYMNDIAHAVARISFRRSAFGSTQRLKT